MTNRISPAEHVIRTFNGVRATARALGIHPSNVSKWRKPKDRNGNDGGIPRTAMKTILELAKQRGLPITGEDLILGHEVES